MDTAELERLGHTLVHYQTLRAPSFVRTNADQVPTGAGVYAWFFASCLGFDEAAQRPMRDGMSLLYIGKARSLRKRLLNHCRNSSGGSTLRRSIGSLLLQDLGLIARQVGARRKLSFVRESEQVLSDWLAAHAAVTWVQCDRAGELESWLIGHHRPPMNLMGNRGAEASRLLQARTTARSV